MLLLCRANPSCALLVPDASSNWWHADGASFNGSDGAVRVVGSILSMPTQRCYGYNASLHQRTDNDTNHSNKQPALTQHSLRSSMKNCELVLPVNSLSNIFHINMGERQNLLEPTMLAPLKFRQFRVQASMLPAPATPVHLQNLRR